MSTVAQKLPAVMTSKQVRDYLGVSQAFLRKRIKSGELVPAKFGNLHKYKSEDVESFFVRSTEALRAQVEKADRDSNADERQDEA